MRRIEVVPVAPAVTRVLLRFGLMGNVNIPRALRRAVEDYRQPGVECDRLSYFGSQETAVASGKRLGIADWREEILALSQGNAEGTASWSSPPSTPVAAETVWALARTLHASAVRS
ncbi:KUP/HAK/KT family potassium transporter [Methylobacterium sp. P31]